MFRFDRRNVRVFRIIFHTDRRRSRWCRRCRSGRRHFLDNFCRNCFSRINRRRRLRFQNSFALRESHNGTGFPINKITWLLIHEDMFVSVSLKTRWVGFGYRVCGGRSATRSSGRVDVAGCTAPHAQQHNRMTGDCRALRLHTATRLHTSAPVLTNRHACIIICRLPGTSQSM